MHKTLICLEKRDFHRLVDVSRHYAGSDLNKCYIFNKRGYTAEMCKEKVVNGVNCIVFGWSNYRLDLKGMEHGYDLAGIISELPKAKKGYILMEFEDNMLINFKNESKIIELSQALNVNKVIRDDFSLVYGEVKQSKIQEIEEFE